LTLIKATLKSPVIFDGRNLYEPKLVRGMGFEYLAIGR
jgi:UDPglucose 6-dehydrogenase